MKPISWTTESRTVADLVPNDHNPRTLSDEQREHLTASIKKFDLAEIPAINTDNSILAGHQRIHILHTLGRGAEAIDCRIPNRKLTKSEADEYLIRSNQNTGGWNWDILKSDFDSADLVAWGFDMSELAGNQPADAPEEFPEVDENISTEHQCPQCGYVFSGGSSVPSP